MNPLQFGPGEDLDRYPRTLDADVAALAEHGVAFVFAPAADVMYPAGQVETKIAAGHVGTLYEGASRPGHFDGMLTVVAKLLNIVQPDVVEFGQKDAQQVFLVRRMVREFDVPTLVDVVPTVREADGLALSSRNRYLDESQRGAALTLVRGVACRRGRSRRGARRGARRGRRRLRRSRRRHPRLPRRGRPRDVPARRATTPRATAVVLVAARVGSTRLIDNTTISLG